MKKLLLLGIVGLSWIMMDCRSLWAQYLPASSSAISYFPHLADGGPQTDNWKTVFRFVNPSGTTNLWVSGTLWFYDPQGSPLALDFGNGAVTSIRVDIPPLGAIQLETTGVPQVLRTGSVLSFFNSPVLAVEEFQNWRNGILVNGASVNATETTYAYQTYADRYTGIAVVNPDQNTRYCSGEFRDTSGNKLWENNFTLPSKGQVSFTLGNVFNFGRTAGGSYMVSCNLQQNPPSLSPPASFTALAIAGSSLGITSSMPPGGYALPIDPSTPTSEIYSFLKQTLNSVPDLQVGEPALAFVKDNKVGAQYDSTSNTISVTYALFELLADSPSEVAYVIGHELGHAHQKLVGHQTYNPDLEIDADIISMYGLLLTGYDVYAVAGALGKLTMGSEWPGMVSANFDNLTEPHSSFSSRMVLLPAMIQSLCGLQPSLCQWSHTTFHPDMAPLRNSP